MSGPKVLFVGHFLEGTAWSRAAIDYVLALDALGVDVVARSVKLGGTPRELPERFQELHNRPSRGCDVIVQHLLPHYFVYNSSFKKNIGMFASETDRLGGGWENYCNLMDEVVVFCNDSKWACWNSNVTVPVHVIPHTVNLESYNGKRNKIDFGGDFLFYSIGDGGARKNWGALIRAFHSAFDPSESVRLVLKINAPKDQVVEMTNRVKSDMRLYPNLSDYKGDIIITDYLSESEMLDLHYSCDCYCTTSHGEGFNLPVLDALAYGKYPVVPEYGGHADIVSNFTGVKVPCNMAPVTGVHDTLPGLFTARENWGSVDITQFGQEMRNAYNMLSSEFKERIYTKSQKRMKEFSYEAVGKQLLEVING